MNIGDVFLSLLADAKGFVPSVQKEAQKAGDAGAKTLGQRLGGALKTDGLKVFSRVASAAFGAAAVGALKLEEAQARVRAETGATAEEARAAAKAINAAAGAEQMSLEAVTEIAVRVRRDMGLVGKAADDMTARMAKFARVTRQDGAAAVEDFDDILDRWNLDASKTADIQNVLIAGWQKWGGTMEGNQKALAALAPQLQALNLTWEDGASLINLFNAAGIEGASQARALNTAIKKLKPGQGLQDLFDEISAIEDPTKRAQKAIEIFGARGGVELAGLLQPGIDSLDDFGISSEEAGDKVNTMAGELDGTPLGRFKKFMSEAAAGVREFGFDLGSAASVLASLGLLLSSIGGGALLKGLGKALLLPFIGLGRKIAVGIATEIAASGIASKVGGTLTSAVNSLPGVPALKTGLSKVGTFMGSTLGKVMGIAAAAAFVVWFLDELNKRQNEVAAKTAEIAGDVADQVAHGTTAQLEQSAAALKAAIDAIDKEIGPGIFGVRLATPEQVAALKDLVAQFNIVQTELNNRAANAALVTENALKNARSGASAAAGALVDEIPSAMEKRQGIIAAAAERWLALPIGQKLLQLGPMGLRAGAEVALNLASGLRQNRSDITAALQQLREDMKNRISPKKEVALRIGQLFGRALSRGLKDSDPTIKAQAEGTRALIEAQLIETVKRGGAAGKKIQEELERKLKSKDPAVKAQAQRTKSLIDAALAKQPAKSPGEAIGDQLNRDLGNQSTALGKTAYNLGRTIADNLLRGVKGTGPSTPKGPRNRANQFDFKEDEFGSGTTFVPRDMLALVHRREIVVPAVQADAIRSGRAVLSGTTSQGGITIENLSIDASGHQDPAAVGAAVRQGVADAMAGVLRDQTARLPRSGR